VEWHYLQYAVTGNPELLLAAAGDKSTDDKKYTQAHAYMIE
jgi:hypothetical protein